MEHKQWLLMPAVHPTKKIDNKLTTSPSIPFRVPHKASPKLIRTYSSNPPPSQHGSIDISSPTPDPVDVGLQWFGHPFRFEIVQLAVELEGFQMYAVEKWVAERTRPVTVLTVYTGDPSHKITVTALCPSSTLSATEASKEYHAVIHYLRKDGARPRNTLYGTIMATSLAHFRSDYTIVHIPRGDMLAVREQLYTNINLLRMGCSGRSALTLEEPSDSTKDRFTTMYRLPDIPNANSPNMNTATSPTTRSPRPPYHVPRDSLDVDFSKGVKGKDITLFNAMVLELIKLVQAGLYICGTLKNGDMPFSDGLLCDETVAGIQRWICEIGEPCAGIEPTERIADPVVVSALLSIVLSNRNKLATLGYGVHIPKDPFLKPQAFTLGLSQIFLQSPHTLYLLHNDSPHLAVPTPLTSQQSSPALSTTPRYHPHQPSFLTRAVIEYITTTYDKSKQSEHRKVHKVIWNKLDDLTSRDKDEEQDKPDTSLSAELTNVPLLSINSLATGFGLVSGGTGSGVACITDTITDLEGFVQLVVGKNEPKSRRQRMKNKSRDWNDSTDMLDALSMSEKVGGVGGSVRALWSGRIAGLVKLRQTEATEQLRTELESSKWTSLKANVKEEKEKEKLKDKLTPGFLSDKDEDEKPDWRTTEDEGDLSSLGRPWGGRVQKKIESWAGLGRKRGGPSVDLSFSTPQGSIRGSTNSNSRFMNAPGLTFTKSDGEEEDLLSSGNLSPAEEHQGFSLPSAGNSVLSVYDAGNERKPSQFSHKRPWNGRIPQSRVTSWADPISARHKSVPGTVHGKPSGSRLAVSIDDVDEMSEPERASFYGINADDLSVPFRIHSDTLKRRASFHTLSEHRDKKVLPMNRMRIDVELCGQLLILHRRERHLANVLQCLEVITSSLSNTNTFLREDYEKHSPYLSQMADRTKVIADIESERGNADVTSQETNTLLYESALFRVSDLWQMVTPPRQKVFALREKVFGMGGRRLPPGVDGAHGSFNRQQWTLRGDYRLVDHMGRTEAEAMEDKVINGEMGEPEVDEVEKEDVSPDVVTHPTIKPIWLLRFFTNWGARWGNVINRGKVATAHGKSQNGDRAVPMVES